ncbi:hypothetical protein PSTG_02382 [Puccinia striiformis f. sp. tritici PST-78]|uniref:DUF659 domain-containing protein n=1 Tax=Puccinia striiformis f. sp. tritici PST-78 TaxID=1165861 RepID=A0A0L0VYW3_9BASI|nr:hypothetical protein PSTG_02382 [Puccinia striiformis f. sp. tritici PST-78]
MPSLDIIDHAQRLATNQVSGAYASYNAPELSQQLDKFGQRKIAWQCKICLNKVNRPVYDSSCSNLLSHANRCIAKEQRPPGNKTLASVGVSGTGDIDPREVLQRCAVWCAEGAKPFLALEEASLRRLLHPAIIKNLPSRKSVSKAIHMLYLCVHERFYEELKLHKGAMYLGVGAWQTPNGFDILGAVVYRLLIDSAGRYKLDSMPLDFVQLKERHTGEYLACVVQYIVEKFGLENRICGLVSDNATNNATMIGELKQLGWKCSKVSRNGSGALHISLILLSRLYYDRLDDKIKPLVNRLILIVSLGVTYGG